MKYGSVRKPTVVKTYACVFVSLSAKAVHVELSSDLTTEAFVACLRKFISRRGKPSVIWSDHGSNFVGANRDITEITEISSNSKNPRSHFGFLLHTKHRMEIYTRTRLSFGGDLRSSCEIFENSSETYSWKHKAEALASVPSSSTSLLAEMGSKIRY